MAAIACFYGISLGAQETQPSKEPLIIRAFHVPKGTFTVADPASKTGERKLDPNFKPVSESDSRPDIKKWITQFGIPFPPGSEALYEEEADCIVVRQTSKNLDQIEAICTPLIDTLPTVVQCEISAYCLPESLAVTFSENRNLPPDALKRLEKSGRLANRLLCIAQSGQEAETSLRQRNESSLHISPIVGPDGYTTDIQLEYVLKLDLSDKEPPFEIKQRTSVRVEDGHSVVIQCSKDSQKRTIVVVIQASLLNFCGWPLEAISGTSSGTQRIR